MGGEQPGGQAHYRAKVREVAGLIVRYTPSELKGILENHPLHPLPSQHLQIRQLGLSMSMWKNKKRTE